MSNHNYVTSHVLCRDAVIKYATRDALNRHGEKIRRDIRNKVIIDILE